jgi:glycosyltransferase involved in cell wall biosynthesis
LNAINVLHINTWGGIGGAFIASDRLHQSLLQLGQKSVLAYGRVLHNSDAEIKNAAQYKFIGKHAGKVERLSIKLAKRLGFNDLGNLSAFLLKQEEVFRAASVLNFHNLHSDYFSYLALPYLTKDKPAIWTLHDMWSFTGHCAYSYDCSKWQTGCGKCPYLDAQPAVYRDATYLEWNLKKRLYQHSNLTIVAPSKWLAEQAQQSLLNRFPIHWIPYGIDTEAYQPLDPEQCRSRLGVPAGKQVLLFGAQSLTDFRKGGDLLLKALQSLPSVLKAETVLLTLGDCGDTLAETVGIPTLNLGYVNSDRLKSMAYSAADLFVFPTRADNLPLVLQESMACGTPMVSFKVGGVPDLVRPGVTGYLAAPEDADDFCNGIVQLLADKTLRHQMSHNCREIALKEYPLDLQAQRYLEVYQQAIAKPSPKNLSKTSL